MSEPFDREAAWKRIVDAHYHDPGRWDDTKAAFFDELDAAARAARIEFGEWVARCCDEAERAGLVGLPLALYRMVELIVAGPPYTIPLFPANAGESGESNV